MIHTTRRDNRGISDSVVYQSQYRLIGIGNIAIELTQRVNDFETVYLARNTKVVVTVVFFNGEKSYEVA